MIPFFLFLEEAAEVFKGRAVFFFGGVRGEFHIAEGFLRGLGTIVLCSVFVLFAVIIVRLGTIIFVRGFMDGLIGFFLGSVGVVGLGFLDII